MTSEKDQNSQFSTWKSVVFSTTIGLMMYYLLGYGFAPSKFIFKDISGFELIYFLIVDQFMIEALYIFLLLKLMEIYARFFNIQFKKIDENRLSIHLFKMIPLFGLIFFFVNPITQTLRYIVRNGFSINPEILLNEYLFSPSLYVVYTVFGSVVGLTVILIKVFASDKSSEKRIENSIQRLVGEHEAVMKPVNVDEICYIEIRDRKYWAVTKSRELKISKTISELENELDSTQFIRISRGVILNVNYVESYSPWESGTYLVELKTPNKKEFSISRNRVKEFKRVMRIDNS